MNQRPPTVMIDANALRLYIIIPKPMTETALCQRFKLFGPLKAVGMLNEKVSDTSSCPDNVKNAYVKFFKLTYAARVFDTCHPATNPSTPNPTKHCDYFWASKNNHRLPDAAPCASPRQALQKCVASPTGFAIVISPT